jgi:hypothetical protein
LIFLAACATTPAIDNSDQLDAPAANKADAAAKPNGSYTNATPHYGELTTIELDADHTFTLSEIGACAGGGTCAPIVETGTYLFTHSTTTSRHYIRLYDEDGNALDRYQWKLDDDGTLELELDGDDHWFAMAPDGAPVQSGPSCQEDTDCSGFLPQFCRVCSDGSTSCAHWSCVANSCQIATCD